MGLTLATSEQDWAAVEHLIAAACRKGPGRMNVQDVKARCASGEYQLWVSCETNGTRCAAVTGICENGDGAKTCDWIAVSGDPSVWDGYRAQIEQWARDMGCAAMRSYSRPGMGRVLPREYRVKGIIFEKAL